MELDQYWQFGAALIFVLALIGLLFWIIQRVGVGGGRGKRGSRLGVVEAAVVDKKRRLVLVRRDATEHLIMIGGPQDVVSRATPPRPIPTSAFVWTRPFPSQSLGSNRAHRRLGPPRPRPRRGSSPSPPCRRNRHRDPNRTLKPPTSSRAKRHPTPHPDRRRLQPLQRLPSRHRTRPPPRSRHARTAKSVTPTTPSPRSTAVPKKKSRPAANRTARSRRGQPSRSANSHRSVKATTDRAGIPGRRRKAVFRKRNDASPSATSRATRKEVARVTLTTIACQVRPLSDRRACQETHDRTTSHRMDHLGSPQI